MGTKDPFTLGLKQPGREPEVKNVLSST